MSDVLHKATQKPGRSLAKTALQLDDDWTTF